MHTYQADLERSEKELVESKKVSAMAGRGRVYGDGVCIEGMCKCSSMQERGLDGYAGNGGD